MKSLLFPIFLCYVALNVHPILAQNKPKLVLKDAVIIPFDDKKQTVVPDLDSAQLVSDLSNRVCAFLETGVSDKTVNDNNFVSLGFVVIQEIGDDSLKFLERKFCPSCTPNSAEGMTSIYSVILKNVIKDCPIINTLIRFDGKQRPAYAHMSQQLCRCMNEKISNFKDRDLAILKFGYLQDSCVKEIFADATNRDIVFKANDFETKAQVDSFDMNFKPYVYKTCELFQEVTMFSFKEWVKKFIEYRETFKPNYSINERRNNPIQPILHYITATLGYPNSDIKLEEHFMSAAHYKASLPNINTAKALFSKLGNQDYIQDIVTRSDKITEIRLTIYQFFAKTKKRMIKGIIVFEFEQDNEQISSLRFIPQNQIPNYEALQKQINER